MFSSIIRLHEPAHSIMYDNDGILIRDNMVLGSELQKLLVETFHSIKDDFSLLDIDVYDYMVTHHIIGSDPAPDTPYDIDNGLIARVLLSEISSISKQFLLDRTSDG